MKKIIFHLLFLLSVTIVLSGCVSSRHVPQGRYLLDKISLQINDSTKSIKKEEMINYLRQQPNHKILWSVKLQLGIYNMSGHDSTKWWNRWIRKVGEAPVVYDSTLTEISASQLRKAMVNKGYLDAKVSIDTMINKKKRKIRVNYTLDPGKPHIINSIDYIFPNDTIKELLMSDSAQHIVKKGDKLDRSQLDAQRELFTEFLKNNGYFAFAKEFVTFNADTTENSKDVDLTITINPPYTARVGELDTHARYMIRQVKFITDYNPVTMTDLTKICRDSMVAYNEILIYNAGRQYFRPSVLDESCYIKAGQKFNQQDVTNTYEALGRLSILKFINIQFVSVADIEGEQWLDAYVLLMPGKSQTVSVELEGTNSEGNLGVAASLAYSHRNIGKGAETFSAKFRGAYESLSGNIDGLINNRYMEYSADFCLSYPKFKFPFLKKSFKQKIKASTDFNTSINYQERPEYTRIIATLGLNYKWTEKNNRRRHTITPIDINYVYLPKTTNDFINDIAPDNPLLRYSYEDHFIMRLGYSFYYTDKKSENDWRKYSQTTMSTIRVNAETAGNLLLAINSIFSHRSNYRNDPYKVFGIKYSQYVKLDADYSLIHIFSPRHSFAFHIGLGVAYPYGNSRILPFEKRFYAGGANGVRGWGVRSLGPGKYNGSNTVGDFINQCGDIRLDLNLEYRAKLFWVLEMAAFIDAGNIWTIHNYENQPGGVFEFNSFYKQIALSYGLGLRLDFNYFLLRFDLGMKAYNPAEGQIKWPLVSPQWGRDASFHFSIGYPF